MLTIKYRLNQIFNLHPLYRGGLMALVCILITSIMAWPLADKQRKTFNEQQPILNRLAASLLQQQKDIKKITQYEQQRHQLAQQWHIQQATFLTQEEKNILLGDVEAMALQSHVSLTHIVVNDVITIIIKSDYLQLLNFLELIMEYPHVILTDLQIKREHSWINTVLNLHILLVEEE